MLPYVSCVRHAVAKGSLGARGKLSCGLMRGLASGADRAPPGPPYDVLLCGTDHFACVAFLALLQRQDLCKSLKVLTPPDLCHAWGGQRMRSAPLKRLAGNKGVPVMHVGEGGMEAIPVPESPSFLLLTVSFGHRVPDSMLDRVHSRSLALNLHPSLLPQLRGAAPIQWAIARQLATTGVTVQQLSKGTFDMGAILGQEPVQVPPSVSYHDLESLLAKRGATLLTDVLERLPEHHEHRRAQDDALATRAPKLNVKVSHVRWDQWPAAAIVARHRAFAYMCPLWTTLVPSKWSERVSRFSPTSVRLRDVALMPLEGEEGLCALDPKAYDTLFGHKAPDAPGTAVYSSHLRAVVVRCLSAPDGAEQVLRVSHLQSQSKPTREAAEWWRGYQDRADKAGRVRFA